MNRNRLLGIIAVLAVIAFVFAACGDTDEHGHTHTHEWGEWELITAPTCIAEGTERRVCTIEPSHYETRQVPIDPNAHNFIIQQATIEPTCTTEGEGTRRCTLCEYEVTGTIPALGHAFDETPHTTTPSTCTTRGYTTHNCTRTNCTEYDTRYLDLDPNNHDMETNWSIETAATCIYAEIQRKNCTYNTCNHFVRQDYGEPLGHEIIRRIIALPTLREEGEKRESCQRNSCIHYEVRSIARLQICFSAGHSYTMAIRADGSLWSWGHNHSGQLGDETWPGRHLPARVRLDTDWISVSAGDNNTIAIGVDGSLWTWGAGFGFAGGQVGTDTDWVSVSAGSGYKMAIRTDRSLWAWGANNHGQLGDGTTENRHAPIQIGLDTDWASVSAGDTHTMAIRTDGSLWAWGTNISGELGDGTTEDRHTPIRIGLDSDWVSVSAGARVGWIGASYTVAIRLDGSLWAWGSNFQGQLGDGTFENRHTPVQIGLDTNWISVLAGGLHTTAIRADGSLWTWGGNQFGQLGNGTTNGTNFPVRVGVYTDWVSFSAGVTHTTAIRADGSLWAWGGNNSGQLGDGTTTNRHEPTLINSQ